MYLVLFTIALFHVHVIFTWQEKPGKYEILVKALEQCPDSYLLPVQFSTKINRYNRSVITYSTELNIPYDVDDTITLEINVAKNGNGGYKENYYNVRLNNVCTMAKKFVSHVVNDLVHNAGLKTDICPVPKGKYYVQDYVINFGNVQSMPMAMYGEFRMELNYFKVHENGTEEKMSCIRGYYELKPKQKQNYK